MLLIILHKINIRNKEEISHNFCTAFREFSFNEQNRISKFSNSIAGTLIIAPAMSIASSGTDGSMFKFVKVDKAERYEPARILPTSFRAEIAISSKTTISSKVSPSGC